MPFRTRGIFRPSELPPSAGRRRALAALSALTLAGWLPGCGGHPPLRIASQVWPGYEFLFLARALGWLKDDDVRLIETPAATDSMHALYAGLVDGAALTLDEALRVRAGGLAISVVAVLDISAGADVLLARPGITALSDLAGKRVGVENSAVGALFLAAALDEAGLQPHDVRVLALPIDRHEEAWKSGQVDALVSYSPVSDRLERAGVSRLYDSRRMPDRICDVLAVTPQAVEEKAEAVRKLTAAHFQALDHFRGNPQDAVRRIAPRLGLPVREVYIAYKGLRLPDRSENGKLLGGSSPPVLESARDLSRLMVRAKILAAEVPLDGLVVPDFIAPSPP